jgi:hypothetical protein
MFKYLFSMMFLQDTGCLGLYIKLIDRQPLSQSLLSGPFTQFDKISINWRDPVTETQINRELDTVGYKSAMLLRGSIHTDAVHWPIPPRLYLPKWD